MQTYIVRRDGDSDIENTGGDVDEARHKRVEACCVDAIGYGTGSEKERRNVPILRIMFLYITIGDLGVGMSSSYVSPESTRVFRQNI